MKEQISINKILFIFLILISIFSFTDIIRVANFNALRLGENKKNYSVMAKIVSKFDIIGIEEIIDEKGLKLLVSEINKNGNEKYNYIISDNPVGTKNYKEYYGIVYKENKVSKIEKLGFYNKKNEYIRPPYGFYIKSKNFDFVLILAHSIFGNSESERIKEASNYFKVYKYFENLTKEEDIVLMGDFNLPSTNKGFNSLYELNVKAIINSDVHKTTLSNTGLANSYDNIYFNLNYLREFNKKYGVYNFAENKDYKQIRKYISDHIIVFVEFDNEYDLDY